jgi:two-component system response regulator WspF
MRVAIVNDLMIAVEALRRVVKSAPDLEIAWIAMNGKEAVEKCRSDRPDLVLMDLIMPVMDGVQATCAILVVTATVEGNAARVFEAMGCGALDAVCTPSFVSGGAIAGAEDLLRKINTVRRLIGKKNDLSHAGTPSSVKPSVRAAIPLVAIGCSTGGPKALAGILSRIPAGFPAPIVIVQHVDAQFAGGLAEWLRDQAPLPVTLAVEGVYPEPGTAYLAGTNDHLVIGTDRVFHYTAEPVDNPFRPSVDAFFASIEANWKHPGIAALLTGIGRDGARGLLGLRRAGWHTIAQDERTSVIYGMPKVAAELGAAVEILPLDHIPDAIMAQLAVMG